MDDDINNYRNQLIQVQKQIIDSPDGPAKVSLKQLESDLKELIELIEGSEVITKSPNHDDPLDAEYALFRESVGLNENDNSSEDGTKVSSEDQLDIEKDLDSLAGMKCKAPYKHSWSDNVVYHNALVIKVEDYTDVVSSDEIAVRVMFTNPTQKEMKPCPFYLDGKCKFDEKMCRYSHGEIVLLSSLQDYQEPEFASLKEGSYVLIKKEDGLWYRAVVASIDGENCHVKLESSSKEEETHLQNILPLEKSTDPSNSSDSEDGLSPAEDNDLSDVVLKILLAPPGDRLGSWEQHTRGVGSRIMAKMGYVHGSGLGRDSQGRVDPVTALVYPAGKSLDHCLMLKERAGGDKDLFKAERRVKREKHKHEKALSRAYEVSKRKTDVFTFLNNKLKSQNEQSDPCSSGTKELKNETQHSLNVSNLQLADDVRRTEREIKGLNESLLRHNVGSPAFVAIKEKLQGFESRLYQLQASEKKISTELQQRKDRKKLSVF